MVASRRDVFLARVDAALTEDAAAMPELDRILDEAVDAGRAAWPGVALDDATFLAHVAASITAPADLGSLPTLCFADLYLTAACAAGDDTAVAALTARYQVDVAAALRQRRLTPSEIDEVMQVVWTQLLVKGERDRARIAEYRGRGGLRRWLRSSALRAAFRMLERTGRRVDIGDEQLAALPAAGADPALDYLRQRSAAEFRDAFHAAVAALTQRQRALLRRHYLDGLTVDELGALHGVHRATAARWVADARAAVLEHTRRALRERLQLGDSEMESLIRLIQSQLDVSLGEALASSTGA